MKKVFLFILVIGTFVSCGTTTNTVLYPAPYGFSSFLDYSTLTNKGIYVTESNSVSFDYKTLGSVSATEVGGWIKKEKEPIKMIQSNKDGEDDMYIKSTGKQYTGKYTHVLPDLYAAMERMAKTLKEVGANGVINLRVQWDSDRIIISGMAIRK